MKHILVVSPHLDDAILSCGIYIIKNIKEKNPVTIATVFSGALEINRLTPMAKWFHNICRLGDNAMELRRIEDKKACVFLKAVYIHLNLLECLYRFDSAGNPRYCNEISIFNADISNEQDTIDTICAKLLYTLQINTFDEILIPLAIGRHIDHLITRKAIETIEKNGQIDEGKTLYYEDIPYVCTNSNNNWKEELATNFTAIAYKINNIEFSTYINALSYYKSQINMLWINRTTMIKQLKRYYFKKENGELYVNLWKK